MRIVPAQTGDSVRSASFRSYAADLFANDRRMSLLAIALSVAVAVTESFGLLLLVPLVVAAGVAEGTESSLTDAIMSMLDALAIPFTLGWLLGIYVAIAVLRASVGYANSLVIARLQHRFVDALRFRIFEAVARASWRFHLGRRSSDISHVIASDIARVQAGTSVAFDLFGRAVATLAFLVVAMRLSVPTTALAVILLVALVGVLWPAVGSARAVGAAQTGFGRRAFAEQGQFLDALKLAKSHGNEAVHVDAYKSNVNEMRAAMVEHQRLSARSAGLVQVGAAGTVALLVWVAVTQFDTPGPELLALIAVFSRLVPVASVVLNRSQQVANMMPAYATARQLEHDAVEACEQTESCDAGSGLVDFGSGLELDRVSFSYRLGAPTLDDVSLSIPAGSSVALVGPSGAGKTTIGDLVLGLLQPDVGEIRVGGVPLRSLDLGAWRRQLAYVPQETFLFHDTLRANILWGVSDDLGDDEFDRIVGAAFLTSVVGALPEGLDTVVGDRGHRLSGGERQRVALARALARRPSLLVLDEATSALDSESERVVQQAIDELHGVVTMLVIAHRLSTIEHADQIVVIDGGRVADVGSWTELVERGALHR